MLLDYEINSLDKLTFCYYKKYMIFSFKYFVEFQEKNLEPKDVKCVLILPTVPDAHQVCTSCTPPVFLFAVLGQFLFFIYSNDFSILISNINEVKIFFQILQ